MSTSNTIACNNHITGHFDLIHVCMYSFIFLVGLAFNLTALVFFFHHIKSRSQTVVYMTNLAIADVLLILTLPVRIYYHLGFEGIPEVLCDCLGLILKANMYGSILFLTCICVDRCMAVSFPLSIRVQGARKKSRLVCLGIWMLTFGASVPIYISKRVKFSSNVTNCFDNPPVYAMQPAIAFSTLFVGFGIPLVIMLICSWGLIHTVQKSTVAQTNLVDSRKIQRMITTGLLIFLLSFSPYHGVLVVLSLRDKEPITSRTCSDTQPTPPMLTAYRYSLVVACLNTVLNPIAYYFTTDTFKKNMARGTVKKMFPLYNLSSGQK